MANSKGIKTAGTITSAPPVVECDTVIVGAGIAGVWLLHRLQQQGRECVLIEKDTIGGRQTQASQGMIHGGLKYALGGTSSAASEALSELPAYWQACLRGQGDVDLSETTVLSEDFYLWSLGSFSSRLSTFFASKALRGRIEPLKRQAFPPLFQHRQFKGRVYRLVDLVLDTTSLLRNLCAPYHSRILKVDAAKNQWQRGRDGEITALTITSGSRTIRLKARHYVLTAGEGNGAILEELHLAQPAMQLRPLQQVIVRHTLPYQLYGHCVDLGRHAAPRLTISTHTDSHGNTVWYLGGNLATENADMPAELLIKKAQQELRIQFPWLDFSAAHWSTLWMNRAEPKQNQWLKPDNAFAQIAQGAGNLIVAWPTKLTLAPALAEQVMVLLSPATSFLSDNIDAAIADCTLAPIAEPFW